MNLDPRLNAFRSDLADSRLKGRVEAARFVDGRAMTVRVPLADLRRRPAADAPLETQALCGERVTVFEDEGEGWAWVQLAGDGYVGWMESEALAAAPQTSPRWRVDAPRTLVFPGPDIKLPPLHALPMGALIAERGTTRDHNASYVLVEPFGAVVAQHLVPAGDVAEDFVAVAARLLGAPYLWGGKSALGIDCSGLVQLSLAQAGIDAPRDADMQERWAAPLDPAARRRRGDLVFWKGHVGIMADETQLLHANAHHMMTAIEPLADALARYEAKDSPVTSIARPMSLDA
ncbi:C40 family peptidase [Aureimonas mangrovi]|uniref:C40 family peptidase n=1 Tax=Aureimonas mangrovi TaxID=2758041 RepID=UPI00163DD041|nr:C40 family peptidase [Aureimonas mangrovi]